MFELTNQNHLHHYLQDLHQARCLQKGYRSIWVADLYILVLSVAVQDLQDHSALTGVYAKKKSCHAGFGSMPKPKFRQARHASRGLPN